MQTNNMTSMNIVSKAKQNAYRRAMETLLNCYCREVATPSKHIIFSSDIEDTTLPQVLKNIFKKHDAKIMQVMMPETKMHIVTAVDDISITGNFVYLSAFFVRVQEDWKLLDWKALAKIILDELSKQTKSPLNEELMHQIEDSVNITTILLKNINLGSFDTDPLKAYIESEQSLIYGHPFHPAPKSRLGVSYEDVLRYSPELKTCFSLYYFAVKREFVLEQSLLDKTCSEIIRDQIPELSSIDPDYAIIPVHPWQAQYLLSLEAVIQAIREGKILDLGTHGKQFAPTSSIRTLYHPANPYFYKCSLNVRITNCVRKNAIYELEGALEVTRIIREILPTLSDKFPALGVMQEPGFISVDLKLEEELHNKAITEGFGMILRQNFHTLLKPGVTPLLTGALFGNHQYGQSHLNELLDKMQADLGLPRDVVIEQWFSKYVEQVLFPVLYCYFNHGIVFEPHLQNVLIGVFKGAPCQAFLRDFEGVKLVKEQHTEEMLQHISPRAREALWYNNELGWKRIAYCLFVNNFCEAISQLSAQRSNLKQRLWLIVRQKVQNYQRLHGNEASRTRIRALLNGEPLPGKTNLLNRFFKRADRATTYYPIVNPMCL